jgi:hypothetical protein
MGVGSPCSVEGFAESRAVAGDPRGVPVGRVGGGVALDAPAVVSQRLFGNLMVGVSVGVSGL